MKYNLLFVTVGYGEVYPTVLHEIDVTNGENYDTLFLSGKREEQIQNLVATIIEDRPEKIIFDKSDYGFQFYREFLNALHFEPAFTVDENGLILYTDVAQNFETWSDVNGYIQ